MFRHPSLWNNCARQNESLRKRNCKVIRCAGNVKSSPCDRITRPNKSALRTRYRRPIRLSTAAFTRKNWLEFVHLQTNSTVCICRPELSPGRNRTYHSARVFGAALGVPRCGTCNLSRGVALTFFCGGKIRSRTCSAT